MGTQRATRQLLFVVDPFGLFATYKDEMGVVYEYTNGKIESVHYNGKSVDYT
jgi:hypothetical protein